jgi:uncharacterized protein (DUF362 family)
MKRRTFIKNTAGLGTGMLLAIGGNATCGQRDVSKKITDQGNSPIVSATRSDLRTSARKISADNVVKLVDTAMENFYRASSPQEAWQHIVKPDDVVGIKVNCLAGKGISTNIELVEAIQERLLEIGVKPHHIIVWDRLNSDLERAGYKIYYGRRKSQCYGNDQIGYSSDIYQYGSVGSRISKILLHQCTAIINVPVLKDHGIVGVTLSLKNFFGAIDNPNKYHDSFGDPYIPDVNMIPEIRNKVRLTICDAITAQYEGGPPFMPQWTWLQNGVLVGTDMVALDQIGWNMIEEKRKENGIKSLKEVGREPTYISTAAGKNYGLGFNNQEQINLIKV